MTSSVGYPAPGDLIGAYRIRRRIGMGGMGMVFAATHERLERDVALKVIAPHLAEDETFRARFTREARALATLDSPHVVHVYDHGDEDGHLYIATQLIPDGDLGSMLQARGAPPLRTAVDLMAQVAAGLADAHAAGIVHRDIKPANVLVRETPERITLYLGDFGIARQITADHTPTSRTIGTPSYMAPELHTGGSPGIATDVYSLGCLLWATLTGKAPYAGTSDYQIVQGHLEAPVPQLPAAGALTADVNRILATAMAKDPAERHPTAAALRDDLRGALLLPDAAPEPPSESTPLDPDPPVATAARTPLRVAAALVLVAVLVAAIAGGGWWFLGRDDPAPRGGDATSTSVTPDSPSGGDTPTLVETPTDEASGPTLIASAADERQAIRTLTALLEREGLERDVALCSAEGWVEAVGVPRMIEAGLLTEDLQENTVDDGGDPDPDVLNAGTQATLSCAVQLTPSAG